MTCSRSIQWLYFQFSPENLNLFSQLLILNIEKLLFCFQYLHFSSCCFNCFSLMLKYLVKAGEKLLDILVYYLFIILSVNCEFRIYNQFVFFCFSVLFVVFFYYFDLRAKVILAENIWCFLRVCGIGFGNLCGRDCHQAGISSRSAHNDSCHNNTIVRDSLISNSTNLLKAALRSVCEYRVSGKGIAARTGLPDTGVLYSLQVVPLQHIQSFRNPVASISSSPRNLSHRPIPTEIQPLT